MPKYSDNTTPKKLESELINGDKSVVKTAYSKLVQEFDDVCGIEESTYKAVSLAAIGNDERSSFNIYAAERSIGAVQGKFQGKHDFLTESEFSLSRNSSDFGLNPVSGKSPLLSKQQSCEAWIGSRPYTSGDNVVKEQKPVKANLLLWKFSDYSVSSCHGFSSLDELILCEKIEKALTECDVDFCRESDFTFSCETVHECSPLRFSIRVSLLQKNCQKVVGDSYVVEIAKVACPSPAAWNTVIAKLQALLKGDIKFSVELQQPVSRELSSPAAEPYCPILSKFLDSLAGADDSLCNVEFASVFADMSYSLEKEAKEEVCSDVDINNVMSLLTNRCVDMRRAACIILQNSARTGLLQPLSDTQKEDIVTSLTRCIQSIAPEEKFTNRLKREAVKALGSMENILDSVAASSKDFARKTLVACAGSDDERLVHCAKEALSSSYFDSNVDA